MSKSPSYWLDPNAHFSIADAPTRPSNENGKAPNDKALLNSLKSTTKQFAKLQRKLYAHNKYSLLLVFQAMDAAGKDSTIRAITQGVNPAGFQVFSFKQPSKQELDHDFLWRSATRLPERGRIGIFNRSYYEETLVVRVHPEYLDDQNLPKEIEPETFWNERFESIVEHERHLARNGTVILKFWLNVSKEEQKRRFLERLNNPKKYWKFAASDLSERALWDDYMHAYEAMLNATSKDFAPWYAIPADNKLWMRAQIASIIVDKLRSLDIAYPEVKDTQLFDDYRKKLLAE